MEGCYMYPFFLFGQDKTVKSCIYFKQEKEG